MLMKTKALTLTLIITLTLLLGVHTLPLKAASEMPQMEWSNKYNRAANYTISGSDVHPYDEGLGVVQTPDGGYLIVGEIDDRYYPPHTGGVDVYASMLIKTDSAGNVQWEKNNSGIFHPDSIVQTKDTGFIITSESGLFKIDSEGNVQRSKNFVDEWGDFDVIQTSDGSFVAAGSIESGNNVVAASVIKVDVNGSLVWNKMYSSDLTYTVGMAVLEADDGSYVVAGTSGTDRLWLLKTDVNGATQLTRTYDIGMEKGRAPPTSVDICKAKDGGYVLAGGIRYGSYFSPWLAKIDSRGNLQWHQRYDDGGRFVSVVPVANGGYLMAGSYGGIGSEGSIFLVRTDGFGNFQWNATYDGEKRSTQRPNLASSVIATADGGYAVVGTLDDSIWFAKYAPETIILPDTTPSDTSPFDAPAMLVVFGIVAIVAATISVIVYFKKRKH
jgi:hypothetical protein